MALGKLKCKDCPRCKDKGKIDHNGNHFAICGMGGNMVYPEPRKVKRVCGSGYIHYGADSCGLYETVEQALAHMSEPEVRRWKGQKIARPVKTIKYTGTNCVIVCYPIQTWWATDKGDMVKLERGETAMEVTKEDLEKNWKVEG